MSQKNQVIVGLVGWPERASVTGRGRSYTRMRIRERQSLNHG